MAPSSGLDSSALLEEGRGLTPLSGLRQEYIELFRERSSPQYKAKVSYVDKNFAILYIHMRCMNIQTMHSSKQKGNVFTQKHKEVNWYLLVGLVCLLCCFLLCSAICFLFSKGGGEGGGVEEAYLNGPITPH